MSDQVQIMLVDDERHISAMTRDFLQLHGYRVTLKHNAEEAFSTAKKQPFDLYLLDIRMPMKDGYALASEVRALYPDALIIFLTGNSETEERVQGLRFGADDYITKPFSLEELALRIRNVLRRSSSQNDAYSDEHYDFAGWTFHVNVRECVKDGQKISLTHTEAQLLRMFCHHPEHILYKEEALRVIWADDQHLHGESLKVYVSRLRRLFKSEPRIEFLNLHGKGYRMIIR